MPMRETNHGKRRGCWLVHERFWPELETTEIADLRLEIGHDIEDGVVAFDSVSMLGVASVAARVVLAPRPVPASPFSLFSLEEIRKREEIREREVKRAVKRVRDRQVWEEDIHRAWEARRRTELVTQFRAEHGRDPAGKELSVWINDHIPPLPEVPYRLRRGWL